MKRPALGVLLLLTFCLPARAERSPAEEWDLDIYAEGYLTYNNQGGDRGDADFEAPHLGMATAARDAGPGRLTLRGVLSLESATIREQGSPQLFQTGGTFDGEPIVDARAPRNFFMELALQWTVDPTEYARVRLYAAAAGDPGLGPPPYVWRRSAMELPAAPLGFTLQDSTFDSEGVLSAGVDFHPPGPVESIRLEGSVFNGRMPDDQHWNIALDSLDSWSARMTVSPRPWLHGQISGGVLIDREAFRPGRTTQYSASATFERKFKRQYIAGTFAWGRQEYRDSIRDSYLMEGVLRLRATNLFGRVELVDVEGLVPEDIGIQRVTAITGGLTQDVPLAGGWRTGLGVAVTLNATPDPLIPAYGEYPGSFQFFLRLRSGSHRNRPGLPW